MVVVVEVAVVVVKVVVEMVVVVVVVVDRDVVVVVVVVMVRVVAVVVTLVAHVLPDHPALQLQVYPVRAVMLPGMCSLFEPLIH